MCRPTFDAGVSDWFAMSSVVGSTPCAMTTLPAGAALDATGHRSVAINATAIRQIIGSLLERGVRILRVSATLGSVRRGVKVRQCLLARGHEPEGLGFPRPVEQPADDRARRA